MNLTTVLSVLLLSAGLVSCANQSSKSGSSRKRSGSGTPVDGAQTGNNGSEGSGNADTVGGGGTEEAGSGKEILALAQNLMDKQKSAGEGICQNGACLADTSTCHSLNFGDFSYSLSDDGSKCELDEVNSCQPWEKKEVLQLPAWDQDKKKWVALDVEVCQTDEATCLDPEFNRNGKWYKADTRKIKVPVYFKGRNFIHKPENTGPDEELKFDETEVSVKVCERLEAFCKDNFGELSSVSHSVSSGSRRTHNTCSVSPKFCRSRDMYLNAKNHSEESNDMETSDLLEWEKECVDGSSFRASKLVCEAHGMEYDSINNLCFSDTEDSCALAKKIWVSNDLIPKYTEILKNYKSLYEIDEQNNQKTVLNYAGFTDVDVVLEGHESLGMTKEQATFKGMYPVKPGKRCQYANIETCKLVNKVFDPYQNICVDSYKRNLMLVLRKIEIDNSTGCIDHWMEREGPNASEMAENVAGSILTLGVLPAVGGWNDGKDIRKEAPFSYEVGDFRFLTSGGESGEVLKQPVKNINIPHHKSYAFLKSNIFPVEIRGTGFSFDVKFDVFVRGKALSTGKLLFASELDTFIYTDTHYPYQYKTLWHSLDHQEQFNKIGAENLFSELKGELSRDRIVSANSEMTEWFKEEVKSVQFDGAAEDTQQAIETGPGPSTRMSYTINRSNWDDKIHKISTIIFFNPGQVYTESVDRQSLGGETIYSENKVERCYGRVVWSWQWFRG